MVLMGLFEKALKTSKPKLKSTKLRGRGIRRASPTTVAREVHRGAALRHEPVAKTAVAQADRQTAVQLWARGVLDWIHGFAFHLGLFCLLEEYVRLGFLGGTPAVPGQPVNFGMHLDGAVALQGLGGELLLPP
ncbi:hypothetical protein AK812_SmicGene39149 [Symbiodinium microadriaticum]|uniref:Uncharacterized protein n=1 Tax=Symbiodinium microadriaticum TaxID=2951 RepID=A0A1Q9CBY9_SYMMI|nr:hypothetical protein AK812_SmicGene39149 [Symbiodinium microadriaticum]